MPDKQIRTVSEITKDLAQLIEGRFRFVRVAGEISGLRRPISGHYYFTLKDSQSQIKAVLFKNQLRYLGEQPRDGQQVICDGRISVYEPRGEYQIVVDTIDFHGSGALQIAFEQLKQQLKDQGYFSSENKLPLPHHIGKIILITSPSGAAVHDFLTTCRRRNASLLIQILPVRVQGEGAAAEISTAIRQAHALAPDVIVLCRGGGSIEDLWPFNEACVAHAIHQANIPLITGIGHETDFTIADFCADLRAATPTAAAELLVTDGTTLHKRVVELSNRFTRSFSWQIETIVHRLDRVNRFLLTFDTLFSQQALKLDSAFTKIIRSIFFRLEKLQRRYDNLESRLWHRSPLIDMQRYQAQLAHLASVLESLMQRLLLEKQHSLQQVAAVLDSLSPLATMARGYAIVSIETSAKRCGEIVTDIAQVAEKDTVQVQLHRGQLTCMVTAKISPKIEN